MNQTKKRPDPARGVKTLITAGAVAATLGGWAVLSVGDAQANNSGNNPANNPAVQAPAQAPSAAQPATPRRGRFGRTQPNFGGSTNPNTVPQPNFGGSTDPNNGFAPDQGTTPSFGGIFGGSSGSSGSTIMPRARTRSSR